MTRADPTLLPVEFAALNYQPAFWSATDVVRIRSHGLWRNLTNEVARAEILCRFPDSVDALHKRLEPPWQPIRPAGLDLCSIPAGVLDDYLLAKAPVVFPARPYGGFSCFVRFSNAGIPGYFGEHVHSLAGF